MSYGGSGGSGSIHTSSDVALNNPSDGQLLQYSAALAKWVNVVNLQTTLPANVQTAAYTLALSDAGLVVEINSASAVTVTVPPNSSVAFAVGTVIEVDQTGAGQVTVAAGSGVTINTPASSTTRVQWSAIRLRKRASNSWSLTGDLT